MVPSSTRDPQPESWRKRVSAKRSPLLHSRRFAKRNLDRCARVHLRHHCLQPPHGVENCTLFLQTLYLHLVAFSRPSPLPFPSSRPGTASVTLLMPFDGHSGNLCHAGGWHLRRKPCVELLYVSLFPVAFSRLGSVLLSLACPTAVVLRTLTIRLGT